ncbi:beta strand repeat-containing protein [Melittangium boletus]|uniref:Uncharacterized protein n=1 Tax=Melittangium boletus DSM 14713 TaxID=1294270 RepID=A0A250ILT4_9BACT|nr:hypothetical protein [Melittangium boletus]ATB32182.1 hypothetical protein MEBOL_005658 [Melittangium boletus DSM 14713]
MPGARADGGLAFGGRPPVRHTQGLPMRLSFRLVLTLLLPLALARCSDPEPAPQEYTVGGTVTGLEGSGLVLEYGGETLAISSDGAFTFERKASTGSTYVVKVATHPAEPTQECIVTHGVGFIYTANVTDVTVTCGVPAFKVGGTVTGLVGTGLKLRNGAETLNVTANGAFQFATPVESGAAYAVTVATQPTGPAQRCTVSGGEGTVGSADVTSITVNCDTSKFTVGGFVSGLNGTLVLSTGSGAQEQTVTLTGTGSAGNTSFAFPTGVEAGTPYDVKVKTPPESQNCTISRGTGTVGSANITNIAVTCTTRAYLVNVTVSGLVGSVVVKNNDSDSLTFTTNETKAFNNRVTEGGSYFVTVGTQPETQTCTSEQTASAPIGTSDVTVKVTCVTNQFFVGGTASGLGTGETVTLTNGAEELPVSANGAFQFTQKVDQGAAYDVAVKTAPAGKQCSVANGSGTVGGADVTNVIVACSATTYTVGGNLSGLATGGTVKLRNNGGDELTLTADGGFTFATPVAEGGGYTVTVSAQPTGQHCTVANGSGTNLSANVTNVAVTCANLYTVGGTVTGLSSGKTLVLTNNGGNDLSVAGGSTTFTFTTGLLSGAAYAVAVKTQPVGLNCTVANGSGTVASANVTTVSVTCVVSPTRVSVLRVGDGAAALSGAAAAVTIDTYDVVSGTRTATTPVTGLTIAGSSGSEGFLSRSADSRYVVFAGYSAPAGTASVAGTTSSATPRVVGRIDSAGSASVVATLDAAFNTSNVRSATTVDGSAYWVAGNGASASGGVHYVTAGSTGVSTQVLKDPNNSRVVSVFGGQLYLSTGSGDYRAVSAVGTGLPTASGQTATVLSGLPVGTTLTSPYQFFFVGDATLYIADDGNSGGVFKFTKDGSGNWSQATLTNPGPAVGVAAVVDGTTVHVVATLKGNENKLVTFVDDGTSTAAVTTVATAPANSAFRGVAPAPNP